MIRDTATSDEEVADALGEICNMIAGNFESGSAQMKPGSQTALDGIASGIGAMAYGAQLVVEAGSSDEAVELAMVEFTKAAARAGLPAWPVTRAETISEDDELDDLG